jgi:transposase-like protein
MLTLERAHDGTVPEEASPPDKPRRRSFSPDYKLAILAEYDRLSEPGEKGSLLRREGLYSSHIVEWRRARETGSLTRTGSVPAAAKKKASAQEAALSKAKRQVEQLEAELARTRAALDIMGKAVDGRPLAAHRCGMKSWWGRPLTSTATGAC